jgi:hypothetical protein
MRNRLIIRVYVEATLLQYRMHTLYTQNCRVLKIDTSAKSGRGIEGTGS